MPSSTHTNPRRPRNDDVKKPAKAKEENSIQQLAKFTKRILAVDKREIEKADKHAMRDKKRQ